MKVAMTNLTNLHQRKRRKPDISCLFKTTGEDSDDDDDNVFAGDDDDDDDDNDKNGDEKED